MLHVEVGESDRLATPEVTPQRRHARNRRCRRRPRTAADYFRVGVAAGAARRRRVIGGLATQLGDARRSADPRLSGTAQSHHGLGGVRRRGAVDGQGAARRPEPAEVGLVVVIIVNVIVVVVDVGRVAERRRAAAVGRR